MTTKTNLLDLLRREALNVTQMCERLGVTRNAVNVQLRQLEAEGLVRKAKAQPRGALGKPAAFYEAAPGSEDVSSSAYQTFLSGILFALKRRMDPAAIGELLEQTGRELARQAGLSKPADFGKGLKAAMAAADSLGASTEAVVQADGVLVRNYSCPLGSSVREEPGVCRALASFFSEATGRPAAEKCMRGDRLICQYLIKMPALSKTMRP